MQTLQYDSVEVLVYDPVATSRSAMRAALNSIGFRHIECVSAPVDFAYANYRRNPDLLFCEVDPGETLICEQIQSLRWGATGNNPFAVVVATSWDKSEALIRRIINCGADDVILRPFSHGQLASRIEVLAERRKGFVITHDYIGPDRRRDPTRLSSGLFEPPNTLRMKMLEHMNGPTVEKRINAELSEARHYLEEEKRRVSAFQLGVLFRFLRDGAPTGESEHALHDMIAIQAQSLAHRGAEVQQSDVILWSNEVHHAVEMLEAGNDREEGLRFLERATTNLYQVIMPEKTVEEYRHALDMALANIRNRQKSKTKELAVPLQAPAQTLPAQQPSRQAHI